MSTDRRVFVAFVVSLILGTEACATNKLSRALSISTLEDTVAFQHDPDKTSFAVTAVVRNDDSRPLYVYRCGTFAQREIDGVWTTVFTPFCIANDPSEVVPGDSVVVPIQVFGFSSPNMLPRLDSRMVPGRFRLVFEFQDRDPVMGPVAYSSVYTAASTPFIVRN